LNITNGGQVSNSSSGIVGSSVGASGTVTVNGAGSTWTCNGLNIGSSGSGVLTITNGGAYTATPIAISGYWPVATGTVTVDGPSSSWNNSGILYVGYNGNGTLCINNAE